MSRPNGAAVGRRPYDLLIFDWDGTLMDSVGSIVECTRATLLRLGLPTVPEGDIRGAVGLSIAETIRRLSGGNPDPEVAERIRDTYRELWFATYRERPVLFPGVGEVLARAEAAGYLLAVATGKGRRGLDRDLQTSGLDGRFHATRTADEARSKPDPQMVEDLLDELGVRRHRALVIGDSLWDLQMAAAAGTAAVAVCTGAHPRDRLLAASPLACFEAVAELAAWLEEAAQPSSP